MDSRICLHLDLILTSLCLKMAKNNLTCDLLLIIYPTSAVITRAGSDNHIFTAVSYYGPTVIIYFQHRYFTAGT